MMRLMPKIDDGSTDGPPGRALQTVTVELSGDEAYEPCSIGLIGIGGLDEQSRWRIGSALAY